MWSSLGSSRRYLGGGNTRLLSLLFSITSHLLYTFLNLTVIMESTNFPKCERHSGFGTKLSICVGCEAYTTPGDQSQLCLCRKTGYELDGIPFSLCGIQYHPECIKVEKPFKTRLALATLGFQYTPAMNRFPFICESCTVRALL
jgi:hypothetical protein